MIAVCTVQTRPSSEHCSPTKIHTWFMSLSQGCSNVVGPFLHTLHSDQLITRLRSHNKLHSHVVGKRDRERVQVRCSDLVGSDLPQGERRREGCGVEFGRAGDGQPPSLPKPKLNGEQTTLTRLREPHALTTPKNSC